MTIVLVCLLTQFSTHYKDFVNSPQSNTIFIGLTRGYYEIYEFAHDPLVLWFWRSNSGSTEADSLLKRNHLMKDFHLAAVFRWEARETDDYETKLQKLHMATHFDSLAIENSLSLISLALKHRNLEHLKAAFSLPVLSDFRNQVFTITNLSILLFAVVFMGGIVFLLVKTVYYLPALSHQIIPKIHAHIIDIIKSLFLLIPIIVLRNLYLIFICYAVLLIFIMSRQEKTWLRLNIIGIFLMFIVSIPISNFAAFLNGHNNIHQLYELVNYDSFTNIELESNIEKEFLAYGLKQQGKLEAALALYEELYYQGHRNVAVINNLANIYSLYDEPARAESLYHDAIRSDDRGEPYFNLGLLKLKNIEYSESSIYMEEARKRNFSSLKKEPIDIRPSNSDFYTIIFSEKLVLNGIVHYHYIAPILVIFILSFLPYKLPSPYFCTSCGRPICKDCQKVLDEETLCAECFTKFKATKKVEIEEDLRRSAGKSRGRIRKIILYTLNIIVPGAGLIYLKRHFAGMVLVCFLMIGYIPVLLPTIFVKPAGWITLPLGPVFLLIAIILAIFCYIISFSLIRGYRAA